MIAVRVCSTATDRSVRSATLTKDGDELLMPNGRSLADVNSAPADANIDDDAHGSATLPILPSNLTSHDGSLAFAGGTVGRIATAALLLMALGSMLLGVRFREERARQRRPVILTRGWHLRPIAMACKPR